MKLDEQIKRVSKPLIALKIKQNSINVTLNFSTDWKVQNKWLQDVFDTWPNTKLSNSYDPFYFYESLFNLPL